MASETRTEYAIRTARGHIYRYAETWGLDEIRADQKITGEPGDVLVARTVTSTPWQPVSQPADAVATLSGSGH